MDGPVLIDRPLSLGDILDRAFRLFRGHAAQLLLTALLLYGPLLLVDSMLLALFPPQIQDPIPGLSSDPTGRFFLRALQLSMSTSGSSVFPMPIVRILVSFVVTLALTYQVGAILHSRFPAAGESLRRGVRRIWAYLGATILMGLAFGAPTLLVALAGICAGPLVLLVLVPTFLYLGARWSMLTPALMLEEQGPIDALRRSWQLTEKRIWPTIGFLILVSLLGAVVTSGPTSVLALVAAFAALPEGLPIVELLGNGLSTTMLIVWMPISVAAYVLYYYDLRVRRESYDLDLRLQEVEATVDANDEQEPLSE